MSETDTHDAFKKAEKRAAMQPAIFGDKVAMDAIAILRSQGWSAEDVRNAMFALSQHRWL